MPSSKTSETPAKKTTNTIKKSERLQLATAISNITAKQDAFIKAVEAMEYFKGETLTELDLEIASKKIELDNLADDYKKQIKDGQIETDQYLAEHKYDGAVNILKEINEVPIKSSELQKMRDTLTTLSQERDQEITDLKKKERDRGDKAMHAALNNMTLKHKAEIAELTASVNQQKKEIITLEATIKNLQNELAEQRKLTKDVAEAGRQAPITVTSQRSN
jgi:hypothetical protein